VVFLFLLEVRFLGAAGVLSAHWRFEHIGNDGYKRVYAFIQLVV
jgi:hypothetical protein